ncbi:MAG: SOS response-associated peptidase [Acidimicrobiia bacterium]
MCGRFVQASSPTVLAEYFDVEELALDEAPAPSWNVAPRAEVLSITEHEGRRRLGRMRWGLVPSWAEDPSVGDRMINARAESVAEKAAFRTALERRRCIIPADGFYEWQAGAGGRKQPVYIRNRSGSPLAFAGLWEVWRDADLADGPWLRSCTVVTTAANATIAPVHDRMPVMLDRSEWSGWLDRAEHDVAALTTLLDPAPDDLLELWPVGPRVNSARNDDARLIVREDPLTLFG